MTSLQMDFINLYRQQMIRPNFYRTTFTSNQRPSSLPLNSCRTTTTRNQLPINNQLVVRLPRIYTKLWLSNFYFAKEARQTDFFKQNDIKLVINLSGYSTHPKRNNVRQNSPQLHRVDRQGIHYVNLLLDDSLDVDPDLFRKHMLLAVTLISTAMGRHEGVLIHCAAGINRSVSTILAWAVIVSGWSLDKAIKYIRERKEKKHYLQWDTLSNHHFYQLLREFSNQQQSKREQEHFQSKTGNVPVPSDSGEK